MEIELIAIGKTSGKHIRTGIEEYTDRLKHYIKFRFTELPDVRSGGKLTVERQKEDEGAAILARIDKSDRVVLLDERGDNPTSEEFARLLQKRMSSGLKRLVFVIGGPYGFSEAVYKRADGMISLSRMTFNHEMVRMFFIEQIYRSMTILRGEPYHHS